MKKLTMKSLKILFDTAFVCFSVVTLLILAYTLFTNYKVHKIGYELEYEIKPEICGTLQAIKENFRELSVETRNELENAKDHLIIFYQQSFEPIFEKVKKIEKNVNFIIHKNKLNELKIKELEARLALLEEKLKK